MSENVHKTLHEAADIQDTAERGRRLVSLAAAIIAVLAALGTLFTHHQSILGLTAKNQAILLQARASDTYAKYEAKRVRAQIIDGLLDAGMYRDAAARARMESLAAKERSDSARDFDAAQGFESESKLFENGSERLLQSYETLQVATVFFDVAIVLVSISAVVRTPVLLATGCGLSAVGIGLMVLGFVQGH
ncbi:MAG: DUF4337 family protein [Candidatus Eremiobacteraeota bacterium]|nr:DUF4337 family protein [Candidatus Eremiobacteraeota bacterium]